MTIFRFHLTPEPVKIWFASMRPNPALALTLHAVVLLAFWLILSGMFDLFHISLGVISVALTLAFHAKLLRNRQFAKDDIANPQMNPLQCIIYLLFLFWSIIQSSLRVAYLIAHPGLTPKSVVFCYKVHLPGMGSKVLLANSITLTPGTVTLGIVQEDVFVVHALMHPNDAEQMDHSLAFAIGKIYGRKPETIISDETVITSENSRKSWIYS